LNPIFSVLQAEVAAKNGAREQLVLAQKLFDLPITSYPELLEVETELRNLAQIYELHTDFNSAVKASSSMLWAELDITRLVNSTEEFSGRLKKIKHLKGLPTYGLVEARLKEFQDSLPLIQVSKLEADG
jgi:dynein heavy chain